MTLGRYLPPNTDGVDMVLPPETPVFSSVYSGFGVSVILRRQAYGLRPSGDNPP